MFGFITLGFLALPYLLLPFPLISFPKVLYVFTVYTSSPHCVLFSTHSLPSSGCLVPKSEPGRGGLDQVFLPISLPKLNSSSNLVDQVHFLQIPGTCVLQGADLLLVRISDAGLIPRFRKRQSYLSWRCLVDVIITFLLASSSS